MKQKYSIAVLVLGLLTAALLSADLSAWEVSELDQPYYVYRAYGDRSRINGDWEEALDYYQRAIALKETSAECYYWSAYIYFQRGLSVLNPEEDGQSSSDTTFASSYLNIAINYIDRANNYSDFYEEPFYKLAGMWLKFEIEARISIIYNGRNNDANRNAYYTLLQVLMMYEENPFDYNEAENIYAMAHYLFLIGKSHHAGCNTVEDISGNQELINLLNTAVDLNPNVAFDYERNYCDWIVPLLISDIFR